MTTVATKSTEKNPAVRVELTPAYFLALIDLAKDEGVSVSALAEDIISAAILQHRRGV
jgi:post-segregation antitoxin (ccd killing protein)